MECLNQTLMVNMASVLTELSLPRAQRRLAQPDLALPVCRSPLAALLQALVSLQVPSNLARTLTPPPLPGRLGNLSGVRLTRRTTLTIGAVCDLLKMNLFLLTIRCLGYYGQAGQQSAGGDAQMQGPA